MPGMDELEFREYIDFTGGLWQRGNDRECAPNGLLECTDCYPLLSGGLRAFAEFQPITAPFVSGDEPTVMGFALGIWSTDHTPNNTRGLYIMTVDGTSSPYTFRVLCLATTSGLFESYLAGNGASWDAVLTKNTMSGAVPAVGMQTVFASGVYRNFFNVPIGLTAGSTNGIWACDISTASFVFNPGNVAGLHPWGVWLYQNRILTIGVDASGNDPGKSIWYSEPASTAPPSTANYLQPVGSGADLQFLQPYAPGDLLYMQLGRELGSVQGAITGPSIRTLETTVTSVRTLPADTPMGLVMVIAGEGAYAWDGQMRPISAQILGDPMGGPSYDSVQDDIGLLNTAQTVGDTVNLPGATWIFSGGTSASGKIGCYDNWVLFSNGYVMDARTGAWFTQTSAPGARYWAVDHIARRVYVTCNNSFVADATTLRPKPNFAYWSRMGEGAWSPMSRYSFTLPLIESAGQRTNLRELELELATYNDAASITIEVSAADGRVVGETGVFGPYGLADARADSVRVLVPGHPAEWYKVRVILDSNRSGTEAPTLTKMRVGLQASTRTPVNR